MINNNLMVFESNPDFSDNSRGLWEYVVHNTNYDTFWIVRTEAALETLRKKGIKCALKGTNDAVDKEKKAKYLISSSFEMSYQKNIDQVHVAAWHGFPLKVVGFFDSASATSDFSDLKVITTQSDVITCTSKLSQLTISGMFSCDPNKVKITGFPRNDILFHSKGRKNLEKLTGLSLENASLFLYLPTMRKGLKNEGVAFEDNIFNYSDYDLEKFNNYLKQKNAYIFVKLHFADYTFFKNKSFLLPDRMILLDNDALVNECFTIYHLMNAFNILITDYSSVYVDFLLLNKPIIFSCPDFNKYNEDRGFIVDEPKFMMPGQLVQNQTQLLESIDEIMSGFDRFLQERQEKMSLFHKFKDDKSGERLFKEMTSEKLLDANKRYANLFMPNCSPLYQYTLRGSANIYFDIGEGYSEANKKNVEYFFKSGEQIHIKIDLPEGTRNVRFDPDKFNRWILGGFSVKSENGILINYSLANNSNDLKWGIRVDKLCQIHISKVDSFRELTVSFIAKDIMAVGEDLLNKLKEEEDNSQRLKKELFNLNEKYKSIINSTSWKITKPIRKLKHIVKK